MVYKCVVNVLKEPTKLQQAKLDVLVVQLTLPLNSLEQEVLADVIVSNIAAILVDVTYNFFSQSHVSLAIILSMDWKQLFEDSWLTVDHVQLAITNQ